MLQMTHAKIIGGAGNDRRNVTRLCRGRGHNPGAGVLRVGPGAPRSRAGASPGLVGSLPSPTPVAVTGAAAVPEENPDESADEDEEGLGERLAAGRAWPLKISQATRNKLVAASRAVAGPSAKSAGVATGGVVYYGVVYGESEAADTYYVVAALDGQHFWTREGHGDWRFQGDYDARICAPPVPTRCMPRGVELLDTSTGRIRALPPMTMSLVRSLSGAIFILCSGSPRRSAGRGWPARSRRCRRGQQRSFVRIFPGFKDRVSAFALGADVGA